MAQNILLTLLTLWSPVIASPLPEGPSESCSQAVESSEGMPQTGQRALLQIKQKVLVPESLLMERIIYNPSGAAAPLTESGYAAVADCCCQYEMLEFVRRVALDLNLEVCDEGGLVGITPYHTCEKGPRTYDTLVGDLLRDSTQRCTWIASPGSCKERPSDCPEIEEDGSPFVDCGCSVSKATKPNFPRSTIGQDNLGGSGPDTGAEELRFVNVFGVAQPVRWSNAGGHWCMDVSRGDPTNGNAVWLWRCLADGKWFNQQWTLPASGVGHVRWTPHPDKCLDVANTVNGDVVRLWDCSADHPNMQWTVPTDGTGGRMFLTKNPEKCIDNSGGTIANGNKIQLWDCSLSGANAEWILPKPTDATDLVITSLNAYAPPTSDGSVKLSSGFCPADRQYSKAECLFAAKAVGASYDKTSLDGGADGGLNGRPQGCTLNGDNVEWWGASDNAACGTYGFNCVCKEAGGNPALKTDMANGFGSLALRRGTSTDFRFAFVVSGSSLPHVIQELHMAFSDLAKPSDGIVKLSSGNCPSDSQISKAECLKSAFAVGASNKTVLDGGADGGLNGRPQGCTVNGDNIEWWGASDNAACGTLGFSCVCKDPGYKEFVSSTNYKGYVVDGSTSLTASRTSTSTQFSGSVSVPSPTSSTSMTEAQTQASVMFFYKNVSEFVVTFGSESSGGTVHNTATASLMFSSDTSLETRCEA